MIKYIIYANNQANLIKHINALAPTERYVCEIKPYKSKRSHEQNSRYWKLLTELGKHLGYTQDEMHELVKFKFLRSAIEINGERLPLLKSTSKLNTKEMCEFQEQIEIWGHSLGFYFDEYIN